MVLKHGRDRGVGRELASVLPQDDLPWYKKKHLIQLNISLFCLVLFASANGYDGSMMNGLQALPQWQEFMGFPTGAWLGFINAVQALGALYMYPVVAWSNNRFGRKKTLGIGYFWLILGVGVQTGARSPAMFVIGRLLIGNAGAFFSGSSPVLMTEIAYPTHRSIATALYNCGWYVGSLVAAWTTYGTRNYATSWAWRIPSIAQLAIPVLILGGVLIAPESPRWLASKGRFDEVHAFLVKYHAGGDEASPLVEFELEEIRATLALETQFKQTTSYADMLRTKGNRHRTFISVTLGMFSQWNGVGIAGYYLSPVLKTIGVTSVTSQTMISGFLQVWNLILAVSAAFSVDRLGRRKLFLASCGGMLGSYICITALSASFAHSLKAAVGVAVIPFLFIFYGFYDIAFTPLLASYTCEIWPYELRARGLGVTLISTNIAVFFNIFINPIALQAIQWKYYLVYIILLVIITANIYFFYPETNGHTLETMARVFDGDDAAVPKEGRVQEVIAERTASISHHAKGMDSSHIEI